MWPSSHSQWGNATRLGSESIGRATVPSVTPSEVRAETSTVRALVLIFTSAESAAPMVSMSTLSAPPCAVMIKVRVVPLTSHNGVSELVAATLLLDWPKAAKGSCAVTATCGSSTGPVSRSGMAATESVATASIVISLSVHAKHSALINTMTPVGRFTLNTPRSRLEYKLPEYAPGFECLVSVPNGTQWHHVSDCGGQATRSNMPHHSLELRPRRHR